MYVHILLNSIASASCCVTLNSSCAFARCDKPDDLQEDGAREKELLGTEVALSDAMRFKGAAPEIINGRLASALHSALLNIVRSLIAFDHACCSHHASYLTMPLCTQLDWCQDA